MAAAKKSSKTENAEYNEPGEPIDNAVLTGSDAANADRKTGKNAGDLADKTYYVDLDDPDAKPATKEPERGKVLVSEGDVISESVAAQLAGK